MRSCAFSILPISFGIDWSLEVVFWLEAAHCLSLSLHLSPLADPLHRGMGTTCHTCNSFAPESVSSQAPSFHRHSSGVGWGWGGSKGQVTLAWKILLETQQGWGVAKLLGIWDPWIPVNHKVRHWRDSAIDKRCINHPLQQQIT